MLERDGRTALPIETHYDTSRPIRLKVCGRWRNKPAGRLEKQVF